MRIFSIVALLAIVTEASVARGQTVETQTPFDSAGRVTTVTRALAERLRLAPPAWPVEGDFRGARLLHVQPGGGFVLSVQRSDVVAERYVLTDAQRGALQAAIDGALLRNGRPSVETGADFVSEPAGNSFARRQLFQGAWLYGPLAASLADGAGAGGGLYLATTGATFFVSYALAEAEHFTRAQSDLAGNLGIAGAGAGFLAGYAATGSSDRGIRALSLAAAIAGTGVGLGLGAKLTDAEAHSAWSGIESVAGLAWAGASAGGLSGRATGAAVAIAEPVGYAIGLEYPRHAAYNVTVGDVDLVETSGLVGALYGGAVIGEMSKPTRRAYGTALGIAGLAGLAVGDAAIARRFDMTASQANIVNVGAVAGALIGLAIPAGASSSDRTLLFGSAAVGATLGMAAAIGIANPRDEGSLAHRARIGAAPEPRRGLSVSFPGVGALGLWTKAPGVYPLVAVGF
jgi:hypothetical protein